MTVEREVIEGKQEQGIDEEIVYSITTTPWGSSPTSIVVTAYDFTSGEYTDVSATVLSGSANAVGDVITLPKLQDLTENHKYRIEVKFTCSGNVFEPYFIVNCKR
jgi:hypothetical protein